MVSAALRSALLLLSAVLLPIGTSPSPVLAAGEEVTGDITAPALHSLSAEPLTFDVTDAEGASTVTVRLTDEASGVQDAGLVYQRPGETTHVYGTAFQLVSGDASDGVYQARMSVPRGEVPGAWPLEVQTRDRVGNVRIVRAGELEAAGHPGHVEVTNAVVDVTAPDVLDVRVLTPQVDVRTGPSSARIRLRLADAGSGTASVFVFPTGPRRAAGGAGVPTMTLVEGTTADGWWEGDMPVRQHAHAGTFVFGVRPMDRVNNLRELSGEQLTEQGMTARFEVLSEQDINPPEVAAASLSPVELDVSDADQEVVFEAWVRDDLSGVLQHPWMDRGDVQLTLQHPLGQSAGDSAVQRVSGTALDGQYRARVVIPRSSATGLWRVGLYVGDHIGNAVHVGADVMAQIGLPPAVLVYNTPLPPLDVDVQPADGAALVDWAPPSDVRGDDVTGYVVRDLTEGVELEVGPDERSAVVPGLQNGTSHELVVHAVNRAGESEASAAVRVVPQAGSSVPVSVRRVAGSDRTATAVEMSRSDIVDGSAGAVVLTRNDDYADALAGTPLAAARRGPLLITPPSGLDPRVLDEVRRVLPGGGTVLLLGGHRALAPGVETALTQAGYRTQRIAGADRFATAVGAAEAALAAPRQVLLATGRSFADALGAGAAAAGSGGVVVLTDGERLPEATARYLQRHAGVPALAVGGPAARAVPAAARVVGRDRWSTAVLLAQRHPGDGRAIALATGERFPDALAGGAHAARRRAPLLLTPSSSLPAVLSDHLATSDAREAFVYGGPSAVAESLLPRIRQLLAS